MSSKLEEKLQKLNKKKPKLSIDGRDLMKVNHIDKVNEAYNSNPESDRKESSQRSESRKESKKDSLKVSVSPVAHKRNSFISKLNKLNEEKKSKSDKNLINMSNNNDNSNIKQDNDTEVPKTIIINTEGNIEKLKIENKDSQSSFIKFNNLSSDPTNNKDITTKESTKSSHNESNDTNIASKTVKENEIIPTEEDNINTKSNLTTKPKALIIGAGLGRTGTLSLKAALEVLGYNPCYHTKEIINNNHTPFWNNVLSGDKYNWNEIFNKYNSSTDYPVCLFWEEIIKQYPESKIILTVRSSESWIKSMNDTILVRLKNGLTFGQKVVWYLSPFLRNLDRFKVALFSKHFNNDYSDANLEKTFNEHNKNVEVKCPKEKLLKFEVKEGWKPLCDFLGKEVPKVDFPKINDTKENQALEKTITFVGNIIFGTFCLAVGSGIGYLVKKYYFNK